MVQTASPVTAQPTKSDHAWIAAELEKTMEAERTFSTEARTRGDSPPHPTLAVLYHEIAAADERHAAVIERIATRYGRTPGTNGGGIGQALGLIKDQLSKVGTSALGCLENDLLAKDRAIHSYKAWVHALGAIGDSESASQISGVLTEEQAHRDALQQAFNRMVEQHVSGGPSDGQNGVSP